MRTVEEYTKILDLHGTGFNFCQISKKLNIPRTTIRDFIKNNKDHSLVGLKESVANTIVDKLKFPSSIEDELIRKEYSYFLGIFLGDGCLSKLAYKNLYRLRIALDVKYPNIIQKVKNCVSIIMPNNAVSLVDISYRGKPSCINVSCYSKQWLQFLPFYQSGHKWKYKIELSDWQKQIVENYPKDFWLGLFHSDGSRYLHTNSSNYYYNFSQKSQDITNLFMWCSDLLGIKYGITKYIHPYGSNKIQIYNRKSIIFLDSFAGAKT